MKTTSVLILSATALAAAAATVLARPAEATLTLTEKAQILYLKQEEKLARDVYQVLAAKWGLPAFTRIAASEQTHMNAVDGLITRYGLADTTPTEPGRFSIPELQSLYGQLVTSGTESVARAIEAGVLIEETDIADLEEVLAATRQPDITRVFSNLLAGSRNHLRAFTALAAGDTTVCTQAGAGRCAGMGMGMGQGKGQGTGTGMGSGQRQGKGKAQVRRRRELRREPGVPGPLRRHRWRERERGRVSPRQRHSRGSDRRQRNGQRDRWEG
jgi:hypothetical protein